MRTILGLTGSLLFGSFGWWLGAKLGFAAAVILGAIAGGLGLYYGYRWFDQNLR